MSEGTQAFQSKMVDILNYGALNLAMGVGYRTGLFDVMDALDQPRSAVQIAQASGLNQRYIEEWLGVMVCGEIVEASRSADDELLYYLPKSHGDALARRAGSNNFGVYTQEIPLLTELAMEHVVRGLETGDGITYAHYPRFHDFMSQLADAKHRQVLVDVFLPWVDSGNVVRDLQRGIEVCDLGCGQGLAAILMARAFPASRFTGIDISAEALDVARMAARNADLTNIRFVQWDAAKLRHPNDFSGKFDYVTAFDAIHDQTRPMEALEGVHEILSADGAFSMVDIAAESGVDGNKDHPMGAFMYTVSLMHCMPVGLVDGGAGLGMMWGRQQAQKMLKQAGFDPVTVNEIPNDRFNLHFFARKR